MYCKRCGNKINDDSHFCGKCGMEVDSPSQSTQIPNSTEPLEKNDILQRNRFDKKKILILGAAVLIVAIILIVLFADILPTTESVFSTPIADFTYTYTFEETYDQYTANTGQVFLIIELTPDNEKKLSPNDMEAYDFSSTQVYLGNSTHKIEITKSFFVNGQLSKLHFILGVDEDNKSKKVKLVLP